MPGSGLPSYPRYPDEASPAGSPIHAPRRNNPLAIASLVCGCCGIIPFIGFIAAVVGVVLGAVARHQTSRSGGTEGGQGLALAGIIVGSIFIVVGLAVIIVGAVHGHLHFRHHFLGRL